MCCYTFKKQLIGCISVNKSNSQITNEFFFKSRNEFFTFVGIRMWSIEWSRGVRGAVWFSFEDKVI